jgi:hypothetical protein
MTKAKRKNNKSVERLPVTLKQQVRSIIDGRLNTLSERKIFNFIIGTSTSSSAGVIIPITQSLVTGDGIGDRTGDKITIRHISMSAILSLPTLAIVGSIRLILFADTMANGSNPTVANVLISPSVTGRYEPVSRIKRRFKHIYDKVHSLTVGGQQVTNVKIDIPLELQVYFQDVSNIPGSNSKNALYALVITDLAANQPTYGFDVQLEFSDL